MCGHDDKYDQTHDAEGYCHYSGTLRVHVPVMYGYGCRYVTGQVHSPLSFGSAVH
jgi:hypothetical protein